MELDKRIKPNKMPLTCFDINKAKQFIGKNCYFSCVMEAFENLNSCIKAPLAHVDDNTTPFNRVFCFVLPCDWVEDPNDVETLKKTITELRQKVAEQEKIIERLKEHHNRPVNKTDEQEMNDRWINLLKLISEVSGE